MVRLAVIGVGRIGGLHAKNLYAGRVKGATLAAVCDLDESKTEKYRQRGIPTYTDYKQIEDVDGVIIATQHYFHGGIARYFLQKGVPTLVEKPLTVEIKEGLQVVDTAKTCGTLFAIMFNQRTNRMYRKAKELIASGKIGDIQRVNFIVAGWYRSQAYYNQGGWRASWSGEGGGTLINQCVHQLDILQWLIGMPQSISAVCRTKNRNITTENDVTAVLSYKDYECVFTATAHELRGENRLEIAGTGGRIVIGNYRMTYDLFDKDEYTVNSTTQKGYGRTGGKKHTLTYGAGLLRDLLFGQQRRVLERYAAAIAGKDEALLIAKGEEGLNALSLINGVYLSSWTHKTVELPLDPEQYGELLKEKIKTDIKE